MKKPKKKLQGAKRPDFAQRFLPILTLVVFSLLLSVGLVFGGLWAGLGIGLAIIVTLMTWASTKRFPFPPPAYLFFLVGGLGIIALLNLQSFKPQLSWHSYINLVTYLIPLSLLCNARIPSLSPHKKLFRILPWVLTGGFFVVALEIVLGYPFIHFLHGARANIFKYDRGISYAVIILPAILAGVIYSKNKKVLWPLAIATLAIAALTTSSSSQVAMITGGMTILMATYWPCFTRWFITAGAIIACGWAFIIQKIFILKQAQHIFKKMNFSWRHRTEIWDYTAYRIQDRPWFGWGLDSSSQLPVTHAKSVHYKIIESASSHTHNTLSQIWVELGLVGLVLSMGFMFLVLRSANQLPAKLRPFAFGSWVAAFTVNMFAFNIWTDSLWACFAVTGFLFAMMRVAMNKKQLG